MLNRDLYAHRLGIDRYAEYNAKEAAPLIKRGVNAINEAARNGELAYIPVGKVKRVFLGEDLIEWKLSKRTGSESIILPSIEAGNGAGLGSMPRPDSARVEASVLSILKKQKKS